MDAFSRIWRFLTGGRISQFSPAVADIDGFDDREVVVGSDSFRVRALNGGDGIRLWNFDPGSQVRSSPAIADLDGDDRLEVVFGSPDRFIYALDK